MIVLYSINICYLSRLQLLRRLNYVSEIHSSLLYLIMDKLNPLYSNKISIRKNQGNIKVDGCRRNDTIWEFIAKSASNFYGFRLLLKN